MAILGLPRDEFTQQQLEILHKNFSNKDHGKNHTPVVRIYFEKNKNSFLLTELFEHGNDLAFGLWEYRLDVKIDSSRKLNYTCVPNRGSIFGIGRISLGDLRKMALISDDNLLVDRNFEGKYPIVVYANVALEQQVLIYDVNKEIHEEFFSRHAQGENMNTSRTIGGLKSIYELK